jgi:ADP-ribosylglycohydrolase
MAPESTYRKTEAYPRGNTKAIYEWLLQTRRLRIRPEGVYERTLTPLPSYTEFAKVEGMFLAACLGDSLGSPRTRNEPADRIAEFGLIRDFIPSRYSDHRAVASPDQSTMYLIATLKQVLDDRRVDIDRLANALASRRLSRSYGQKRHYNTCREAGNEWWFCGIRRLTCGALSRIPSILAPHLPDRPSGLLLDVIVSSRITHTASAGIAASASLAVMLHNLLGLIAPPEPEWWIDTFVDVAQSIELAEEERSLWQHVQTSLRTALQADLSFADFCERNGSSHLLTEAIPTVLYACMCFGAEGLEEALVQCATYADESERVGALVGMLLGALHGTAAIPKRWLDAFPGWAFRYRLPNSEEYGYRDGEVHAMIELMRQRFWDRHSRPKRHAAHGNR